MQDRAEWHPTNWTNGNCRGIQAHEILGGLSRQFKAILLCEYNPSDEDLKKMDNSLAELDLHVRNAFCHKLNIYAVEVLRNSVFCKISENFIRRCLGMLHGIWNFGLQQAKNNKDKSSIELYSADDFLNSWKEDLFHVPLPYLPSYIEILRCEGLSDHRRFHEVLDRLEDYISDICENGNTEALNGVVVSLINNMMEPLISINIDVVLGRLPSITRMSCKGGILGCQSPLTNLYCLFQHLGQIKYKKDGTPRKNHIYKECNYKEVANILSEYFKKAQQTASGDTCRNIEQIFPLLGLWERSRRMKIISDYPVSMKSTDGIEHYTAEGLVQGVDEQNKNCHISFSDIEKAAIIETSKVPRNKKNRQPIVYIKSKNGNSYKSQRMLLTIYKLAPDVPNISTEAVPVRAWTDNNEGHIVFRLDNNEQICKMKSQRLLPTESISSSTDYVKINDEIPSTRSVFPEDTDLMMDLFVNWLRHFYTSELMSTKRLRGFWNGAKPANELAINAQLRGAFDRFARQHGGQLSSEEEAGSGKCDFCLNYLQNSVAIELKPSYSSDLVNSISSQLPIYMDGKNTKSGLLLVPSFENTLLPDSVNLKNILAARDQVCKEKQARIDLVIMNFDIPPAPSSKIKQDINRFRHYKAEVGMNFACT